MKKRSAVSGGFPGHNEYIDGTIPGSLVEEFKMIETERQEFL